ncbi:hypothetical protein ACLVWQ_17665 (plasmid) [Streptomyces sp. CWNU-52B]|uniref:hypothetical protein n=1 Tax=unclassified Streptomyces TaxID=2593676 RepID=UPI0039C29FF7
MADLSMPTAVPETGRRLIAAGFVRRLPGRTLTVRATLAGVTGTITPTAGLTPATAQKIDDDSDDACPVCGYWTCQCANPRNAVAEAVAAR